LVIWLTILGEHSEMKYFKYISLFFFLVCVVLSVYSKVEVDEFWSYTGVLHSTASQIIQYAQFKSANNQLFNSLYIHFLQKAGVKSAFMYRLLSLSSFIIYSFYYYRIIIYKTADIPFAGRRKASYAVIYLFPYILTFFVYFSMSRGYALAIATFMGSLYYFMKIRDRYELKDGLLFVFLGILSSLSIFSFAYVFAAMLLMGFAKNYKDIFHRSVKSIVMNVLVFMVLLFIFYYIYDKGAIINSNDKSIDGGNNLLQSGLISSIFSFLALQNIALQNYATTHSLFIVMRDAVIVTIIPVAIIFYRKATIASEHLLLVLSICLMVISHLVFGSKYPYGRALSGEILLLYLPFVTYSLNIQEKKEWLLYNAHFFVLTAIGLYGICSLFLFAFLYPHS